MDLILDVLDHYVFDQAYAAVLPKDGAFAQQLGAWGLGAPAYQSLGNTSSIATSSRLPLPLTRVVDAIKAYQNTADIYGLEPQLLPFTAYTHASLLERPNLVRLTISIFLVTAIFGWLLYFLVASISYFTVFDKKIFNHPRYLKNQMSLEMIQATTSIPLMVLLTVPFFLLELKGFSRLYFDINASTGGWSAVLWQIPSFILFTDCGIYFIHRFLHWPPVYKKIHKPHHKWIVCTPFASHAFHAVDGWAQSLPYHLFPLVFPLHKVSYLFLFTFVNFWTVMIHDGQYLSNDPFINGTACHTVHHLYFNYNYGQFTTLWDRLGNSYRRPDDSLFVKDTTKAEEEEEWRDQTRKMEEIRGVLEGKDDRVYVEPK